MKAGKQPLVSVCIITYNQEHYIAQCITGALEQQADFEYEIVIGEDHSTDGTAEICEEFAARFPEKIRLIKRPENLGMIGNWMDTIQSCTGKYVALCEGDDYWDYAHKLQKQVDFLEANANYALSFHDAAIINERDPNNTIHKYSGYEWNHINPERDIYDLSDLLHATLCPTPSVVFRKPENFMFPGWYSSLPFADMSLFILVTGQKKIKFFNEMWCVYRRHATSASAMPMMTDKFNKGKISMYLHLYESLPAKQQAEIPAILKENILRLPDIMMLTVKEREQIKKIVPAFYRRRVAAYYKKTLWSSAKKIRERIKL